MTKKNAIDIIKSECYVFNPLNFDRSTMVNTALDMAVKALEQEPVLDKLRADIGSALSEEVLDDNRHLISDIGIGLEIALGIIDKYKAESEVD